MDIAVTDGRISQMIAAGVGAGDHAADGKGALTPGVAGDCGRGAPPGPPVRRGQVTS